MKKHRKHHRRTKRGFGAMKIVGLSIPALAVGAAIGVVLAKRGVV